MRRAQYGMATGRQHLALLNSLCVSVPLDDTDWSDPQDWAKIAAARFGHEPILVHIPVPSGVIVKAVCPGAAIYFTRHQLSDDWSRQCPIA